jgi:hypothetical protein
MNTHFDLTICTVSFHSKSWLDLNWKLTSSRNPQAQLKWVIVENSPSDSDLKLASNDPGFTVIPGPEFEKKPYASGSYHHAAGMNKTINPVSTRYVLFIDPDFFIIRQNWINEVIAYMKVNYLAILGVPWHPQWVLKNRYFPCVHCMLVDLEQIPRTTLDFTPDYEQIPGYKDIKSLEENKKRAGKWLAHIVDPLKFRKRRYIGTSRDVGWRIYKRYFGDPRFKIECLQPVFHPRQSETQKWLEMCLPDRFSFVPKKKGYFTEKGFRERGLADLDSLNWEEFIWKDEPFGFHVRSQPKVTSQESMDLHYAKLIEFLNLFQQ